MSATADRTRIGERTPQRPKWRPGSTGDTSGDTSGDPPAGRRALNKALAAASMLALLAFAALIVIAASAGSWEKTGESLRYYTVPRGDLSIQVVERGNLESQENVEVKCEVDDVYGDGIVGTTILWIVPNGSLVKKGDLLVELDSTSHERQVDDQVLEMEEERAHLLQHTARYENQKTRNETSLANAELQVKLAELNLRSFEDHEGGVFQLGLQDVEMRIRLAEAKKLISDTDLKGHEVLHDLGYSSSGDVAQARLSALSAGSSLTRAKSERKLQVQYNHRREKLRLNGAVETAKRNVHLVTRNNEWLLARELALMHSAERRLKIDEDRMARYQEHITKCMIYAPQDGMVVYGRGIHEGEAVYQRRTIIKLPNLSRMQVKTTVHETGVNQVRPGLPATVRLNARPGVSYTGCVKSVSVLPDQSGWLETDVKVYETIVTINEDVEHVQPGMTAVVQIDIQNLMDVLIAPVESIVQIEGDNWCYVDGGGGIERRLVTLGATNDQFVEIEEGLNQGDRLVLDPTSILDEAQRRNQAVSPDYALGEEMR